MQLSLLEWSYKLRRCMPPVLRHKRCTFLSYHVRASKMPLSYTSDEDYNTESMQTKGHEQNATDSVLMNNEIEKDDILKKQNLSMETTRTHSAEKQAISNRLRMLFNQDISYSTVNNNAKKNNNDNILHKEHMQKYLEHEKVGDESTKNVKDEQDAYTVASGTATVSVEEETFNEKWNAELVHKGVDNERQIAKKRLVSALPKSNHISVQLLEQELIDDGYTYFPEISEQIPRVTVVDMNSRNSPLSATTSKTTTSTIEKQAVEATLHSSRKSDNNLELLWSESSMANDRASADALQPQWVENEWKNEREEEENRTLSSSSSSLSTDVYIPGEQIIDPGFTRYRLEVQYQGCDFDGWHKSTKRKLYRRTVQADGTVLFEKFNSDGSVIQYNQEGNDVNVTTNNMSSQYSAKVVLEEALAVALDVSKVNVIASVIPETGVSVRRLTCHVDIPSEIEMQPRTILQRTTMWLEQRKQPLAVLSFTRCTNQDFHARFSCLRRTYCYRILNRVAPPLFDAGFQWHVDRHLNINRMKRFAQVMTGTHDFGYFADPKMANALRRAAVSIPGRVGTASVSEHYIPSVLGLHVGEQPKAPKEKYDKGLSNLERAKALPTFNKYGQKVVNYDAKSKNYYKAATNLPTIRTIDAINVVRQEDEVIIWFVGQSFLRHQIRNMVSVLKAAGHGLWDEYELQYALNSGFTTSRKKYERERLPPAPVHGLTLWDVEYSQTHANDEVAFVDSGPFVEANISNYLEDHS